MKRLVFDTQALLRFYFDEPGAGKVQAHLEDVRNRRAKGYINVVTLTELYYVLTRADEKLAEEKERNLRSFGVKVVSLRYDSNLWKSAALIKTTNALSLADAFGAATALYIRGALVTGSDGEFDKVKDLKLERIR
jgi:predicted nucleic acid-binding protein